MSIDSGCRHQRLIRTYNQDDIDHSHETPVDDVATCRASRMAFLVSIVKGKHDRLRTHTQRQKLISRVLRWLGIQETVVSLTRFKPRAAHGPLFHIDFPGLFVKNIE